MCNSYTNQQGKSGNIFKHAIADRYADTSLSPEQKARSIKLHDEGFGLANIKQKNVEYIDGVRNKNKQDQITQVNQRQAYVQRQSMNRKRQE